MYKKFILNDTLTKLFKEEILSLTYIKKNDKIIIAVSGGMDSTALLLLLQSINIHKIIVAHVDHSIRKDSISDRVFVEDLCKDLGVPFYFKTLDFSSRNRKDSVEKWAREKRYQYFINLALRTKSDWVMTGHHANDQAETLLLNLSRQSGISGLTGISRRNNKIIRPLLPFNKKLISEFAERIGFPFIEDSTNADMTIPRNFIRKNILKPWESEMPFVIKGINNSTKYFNEWKLSLDHFIINFIIAKLNISDKRFEIPLSLIKGIPSLGRIRLIQLLFKQEKLFISIFEYNLLLQEERTINLSATTLLWIENKNVKCVLSTL